MKQLSDHIKASNINENEVDDFFKKQDEFKKKMIDEWKSNDKLKPFDSYFKWKNNEGSIQDVLDNIIDMRKAAKKLLEDLYENEKENDELIMIVDAIEMELINIMIIKGIKW